MIIFLLQFLTSGLPGRPAAKWNPPPIEAGGHLALRYIRILFINTRHFIKSENIRLSFVMQGI